MQLNNFTIVKLERYGKINLYIRFIFNFKDILNKFKIPPKEKKLHSLK